MTLVVAYPTETGITALADSRISRGPTIATDAGVKLFMIPLRVKSRSESQHDSQLFHTVGLAFAGNTLIATNCHSLASTLTQNLWSEGEVVIPSLASVAKLYASVAEYITKDYNSRLQFDDFQKAEMFIFGYCAIAKRLIFYFLSVQYVTVKPSICSWMRLTFRRVQHVQLVAARQLFVS